MIMLFYRMALTSGEFNGSPVGVIGLIKDGFLVLLSFGGAGIGLRSFRMKALMKTQWNNGFIEQGS